jgi:hypothetical protein
MAIRPLHKHVSWVSSFIALTNDLAVVFGQLSQMAMQRYPTSKTTSTSPVVDRQLVTFFCFAKKKVTKEKATPVSRPCGVPCVARLVRRLRNSHCVLKQSSPKTPDQPPLLGGAQGMKSENLKIQCA